MANLAFDKASVVGTDSGKIFGTADTAVQFEKLFAGNVSVQQTLPAIQRGPVRFYRDNVVAFEDDLENYLLFVVSGVVRRCKTCKNGTRNIVAFNLPGDLFGWTDVSRSLAIEAASDTEVLFLKRSSLLSLATRDGRVGKVLLNATTNELARAQEHILLMSKPAKCRVATFLSELWVRLGKAKYLEVPFSYQDIADYLGLTIETLSRSITELERSGLISRVAGRTLLLRNHFELRRLMH